MTFFLCALYYVLGISTGLLYAGYLNRVRSRSTRTTEPQSASKQQKAPGSQPGALARDGYLTVAAASVTAPGGALSGTSIDAETTTGALDCGMR